MGHRLHSPGLHCYAAIKRNTDPRGPTLTATTLATIMVEGLEGKGGMAARRQISTKELADYVIKRHT
jgi:hypothetical protein